MTAQQSERPDRCIDGRVHFKKRINGEWVCVKCTFYCKTGCGRQVATEGARCIRCGNGRGITHARLVHPSAPSPAEG